MVANSNARLPPKSCRTRSHPVNSPTAAVSGAEISAIQIVVEKEDQAEPRQSRPCSPHSTPKALE